MEEIEASTPALVDAVDSGAGRVVEMEILSDALVAVLPSVPVDPVVVDDVVTDEFGISFSVDRVGAPVLVRASYFPNWSVSGAEGPFRVAPNVMVVLPTDTEVELSYGRSPVEVFGVLLTLLGFVGLRTVRRVTLPDRAPLWDLSTSQLDQLPSRELVVAEVEAGRSRPETIDRLERETTDRLERTVRRAGIAGALVVLSVFLHLFVGPDTEGPLVAIAVWAPGVVAGFVLLVSLLPDLGRLVVYRATVARPARLAMLARTAPAPPDEPVVFDEPSEDG